MRGLVLEGGAMRGLFTCGVLDYLMEKGIEFDGLVGVSAGTAFGCNYKSRQIGRALRYNREYCKDQRYCSVRSLIKTGDMYNAKFCYHVLPTELDPFDEEAFVKNPMEFYVVATNVKTGEPVYKKLTEMGYAGLEWIRASSSMPLVSNTVILDGMKLLDGGVADSIPLKFFRKKGYDKIVTVLTKPRDYVKSRNRAMPYIRKKYKDYPKFIEACENRHIMYNSQMRYVNDQERLGNTFVIAPKEPLPIGHITHSPDKLQKTYDLGRAEADRVFNDLIRYLLKE
ncbi:MAG: patatin family protein [Lachnospiraceae bacterium]|nr:patatin family protein [Lachnospiraceae bacterium]